MARKSFQAKNTSHEPVEFDIDGEVFHIKKGMAGSRVLRLFEGASNNDDPSRQIKDRKSVV